MRSENENLCALKIMYFDKSHLFFINVSKITRLREKKTHIIIIINNGHLAK